MARHKTSVGKTGRRLPTGARLVAAVAVTAAGAGALAAALIPAGGSPGLHEDFRPAHVAASRPAPAGPASGQDAPAPPTTAQGTAAPGLSQGSGGAAEATPASPSKASLITQADAQQKQLDSTSPSEVLKLVNEVRITAGIAPLTLDSSLDAPAAQAADYLSSHGSPGAAGPVSGTGWRQSGATGATTTIFSRNEVGAQAAVNDWMKHPAERAQLLDPNLRTMGVASRTTPDTIWWAGFFGS
ncbi:CAP domain-containing protein [Streptomyces sp. NBC_01264]|uniref:CAP domain-containing protein n=1 Tax=Streptomyces sp. NBC_01264 TaxID=2903804 RepID=UPI002251AA92|nr:CAP domain-containing protein [Streptomyces sp. NBC_01264]MCX4781753.1 CAP domain-containing protein [Streptomyces sp. NBC_01264]